MTRNQTASMDSIVAAKELADMISTVQQLRIRYERNWYDNGFFDDGYHFRYVSQNTGRVIDKTNSSNSPSKMRAIPKASKQIRGIANLLVGTNPHPVIYPERVLKQAYIDQNGQLDEQAYQAARENAKQVAKKSGHWLNKEIDDDEVMDKATDMIIIAAKQSIAYLKIVPDSIKEDIIVVTRDAFDVYLWPMVKDIDDSPFVAESVAVPVQEIWNNELYNEEVRMQVQPDNKFSGNSIKDAYLRSKFGVSLTSANTGTVIKTEGFIREYLNKDNYNRIAEQEDAEIVLAGKKMGDPIIRQIVTTLDGKPLYDHYTTLTLYPYAPFRFEPGYMYQVSQIERFIPSNKSLDAVVSRLEGFLHTMVTGMWAKRKGEGFRITNQYGGQIVEYDQQPPTAIPQASPPQFVFQFINLLNSFIEEQGLSVNTLAQIPSGVKAFKAIESLKESELNNLQIPLKQFQKTMKRVAQLYLQYGADYFTKPREVPEEDQSEPDYYDVIGERAFNTRKQMGMSVEGMVPIKKDAPIKIEVENGAAFTEEGRKSQMLELITTIAPFVQSGMLPPEFVKLMLTELVDTFKVGTLQEMMDSLEGIQMPEGMSEDDIQKIKIAMLEVMKDTTGAQEVGGENVA